MKHLHESEDYMKLVDARENWLVAVKNGKKFVLFDGDFNKLNERRKVLKKHLFGSFEARPAKLNEQVYDVLGGGQ
jgi:hypothetical protein